MIDILHNNSFFWCVICNDVILVLVVSKSFKCFQFRPGLWSFQKEDTISYSFFNLNQGQGSTSLVFSPVRS